MKKFALLLVVIIVFALVGSVVAQEEVDRTGWPETFIIGVYPGDNVEQAIANTEPLVEYLQERLGIRTVAITGTSYSAVIEAMRAGRADAMEVGPFAYVLANREANAEAIAIVNYDDNLTVENAAEMIDTEILPGYYSLYFTRKGSGIRTLQDVAGRTFAFTDPASASGYLIPAVGFLNELGFDSAQEIEDFARIIFAGNHPAAVLSVSNGTTDAGATFDANLPSQASQGLIELCGWDAETNFFPYLEPMTREEIDAIYDECPEGNVVVFGQSPVIPETPFAIRGNLPESFKTAVREALLDIANQPEVAASIRRYYVDPSERLDLETLNNFFDALYAAEEKLLN